MFLSTCLNKFIISKSIESIENPETIYTFLFIFCKKNIHIYTVLWIQCEDTHERLHQTMARPRPAQVCSRAIIRFVHLFSQKASCWNITTRDAMALICIVVDFYV